MKRIALAAVLALAVTGCGAAATPEEQAGAALAEQGYTATQSADMLAMGAVLCTLAKKDQPTTGDLFLVAMSTPEWLLDDETAGEAAVTAAFAYLCPSESIESLRDRIEAGS